jgi:hypothetical protein
MSAHVEGTISNAKAKITDIGGYAIKLTNKTGAASVKGELVETHASIDNAVGLADADAFDPIGVFLDSGVADGSEAWVVYGGIAEVMLKDSTAAVAHSWVGASDVSGRADASDTSPPGGFGTFAHFREVGHGLEAKSSGTDVTIKVATHFN